MTTSQSVGQSTGGKPINLRQLQGELEAAGVDVTAGLGMSEQAVYTYDADGQPVDFADQQTVDQAIAGHMALRDKTAAEYATEFQNPAATPARKQEIRDIQNGLMPPEQVAVTQAEWDARTKASAGAP